MLSKQGYLPSVAVKTVAFGVCAVKLYSAFKGLHTQQKHPPVLKKKPHMVPFGAITDQNRGKNPMSNILYLEDPYFYVRDDTRKNHEILEHLRKENEHTKYKQAHLDGLRSTLYKELLSHVQETDSSCPYPFGQHLYFTRTEQGSSYKWHCRKQGEDGKEQILLDENELAKGHPHCDVGRVSPSPDHNIVAYSVDFSGYETYTIYFKDPHTGNLLADKIENTTGSISWGLDNQYVFFSTFDDAHRENKVWRHKMGSPSSEDVCLFTEDDEQFNAGFYKSFSGRFLFMASGSSETSECHALDLNKTDAVPFVIQPRIEGVKYSVSHHKDSFFIVTNRNATNFKLVSTAVTQPGVEHWKDVFPYNEQVKTDNVVCFQNHLVIEGRQGGFTQIWVAPFSTNGAVGEPHPIPFDEPIYTVGVATNKVYDASSVRLVYSSFTTPDTTIDYDMTKQTKKILKETPCLNYDRSLYCCERLEATSNDGTKIPMSMVYRKDKKKVTDNAVHLYGYGSYEISIDPDFRSSILPLLDRGVAYVIAHIRGGGEQGRTWYEDAKYLTKKKTFEDFVACAQFLVDNKITTPQLMTCEGRSAGGLLIGAVLNMRPDLFVGAIAGVPFVDVVNTMSDATIPLTTGEWEEWGNPNEEKYFHYMLSYSPYDNIKRQDYPSVLVTSGLFDPRVAYWEPTKWVAKLRDIKTDNNDILLKMELDTGHFSASDRYHYLKEKAFDQAFLLDKMGLAK